MSPATRESGEVAQPPLHRIRSIAASNQLRRWKATTPGWLMMTSALAASLLVLTAVLMNVIHARAQRTTQVIARRAIPAMLDTATARAALSDSSRVATIAFESGGMALGGPGQGYQDDIKTANQQLQLAAEHNAAAAAGSAQLQSVGGLLIVYTGLIEQAHANSPVALEARTLSESFLNYALDDQLYAQNVGLLARLDDFEQANAQVLGQERTSPWLHPLVILAYAAPALLLLGLLCFIQVFLRRRFRRRLNPCLLAATALLLLLTGGLTAQLLRSDGLLAGRVHRAQADVIRLWQSRAVAADAYAACVQAVIRQADADSPTSVASSVSCAKSAAFVAGTAQPTGAALTDADVAAAAHVDAALDGLLASGIRDAATRGAHKAAVRAVRAFADFTSTAANGGNVVGAGRSQVGGAWNRLDSALEDGIVSDRSELDTAVRDARTDHEMGLVIPAVTVAIAGLIIVGLRPRIAEYWA